MFLVDSLQICIKSEGKSRKRDCEWMSNWSNCHNIWIYGECWVAEINIEIKAVPYEIKWRGNRD